MQSRLPCRKSCTTGDAGYINAAANYREGAAHDRIYNF